jgi:Dolichyl-phosphate-mannose-protein mannosyltransferase
MQRFLTSISRYIRTHPGPLIIAGIWFIVRMLISTNYGYFRDELFFLAAGRHLAFGYVDWPPLVPFLAWLVYTTTGGALWALHLFPALANAFMIIIAGQLADELGGRTWAQTIAALGSSISLTFMATGSLFTYDSFDALWWVLLTLALIRILKQNTFGNWAFMGIIVGLGLLTKWTIVFWICALIAGLLLTSQRKLLFTPRILLAAVIAIIMFMPCIIWNATHNWATMEFMSAYTKSHVQGSFTSFGSSQFIVTNPFTVPIWIAGLVYFFTPAGKQWRMFGWAYLILFAFYTVIRAKSYYMGPAYPILFAGAGLWLEQLASTPRWRWATPTVFGVLVLSGIYLAPAVLPIMPPSIYGRYYSFFVKNSGARQSIGTSSGQPQMLADRFGWEEQVRLIADVYHGLSPDDQQVACIFAANYGEEGALYQFGSRYGLPTPISARNAAYLWGPLGCSGEVVITIGAPIEYVNKYFDSATLMETTDCPNCAPSENGVPIIVARHSKEPFQQLWPQLKIYA